MTEKICTLAKKYKLLDLARKQSKNETNHSQQKEKEIIRSIK